MVEVTRRSRGCTPVRGANSSPERRALYVHYLEESSVQLAGRLYEARDLHGFGDCGGLSEREVFDPERPLEPATLYVRPVVPFWRWEEYDLSPSSMPRGRWILLCLGSGRSALRSIPCCLPMHPWDP